MGKDEMATLLETMLNDVDVAGRVGEGDFTDIAEGELTAAEQALLSAAGNELAESDVSGFGSTYYLKIGDIEGESRLGTPLKFDAADIKFALDYLGKDVYKF